jgi:hypothetical protein
MGEYGGVLKWGPCRKWGCQVIRNKYFPLLASLASIALLVLFVCAWAYYFDLSFDYKRDTWFESFFDRWVDEILIAVIIAMCGLSLAGLITGISHLFKRVFKPIIIMGTILSGLTTILCARLVYVNIL